MAALAGSARCHPEPLRRHEDQPGLGAPGSATSERARLKNQRETPNGQTLLPQEIHFCEIKLDLIYLAAL